MGDQLVELEQVRMSEVREGPELRLEAKERPGIERRQGLHRDRRAAYLVVRLIDGARGAEAEHALEHEAVRDLRESLRRVLALLVHTPSAPDRRQGYQSPGAGLGLPSWVIRVL